MEQVIEPTTVVSGHEQLTSIFGGAWPSFHDAEVLSIRMEREGRDVWESPALYAAIHVFAARRDDASATGVEFYNHTIVTLRFNLVLRLKLIEFNHQNAIFDLIFERLPDAPADAPLHITFQPAFGIDCSFFCQSAEVVSVEKRLPANSVYA